MQRVLGLSPILFEAPPRPPVAKRPLKRTASLASLPTPPRTVHNKKRARKEDVFDEASELEETSSSAADSPTRPLARTLFQPKGVASKKSVADRLAEEAAAEDSFWEGSLIVQPAPEEPRRKASSTIGSAPASPPPSTSKQVGPRFTTPPPVKERKKPASGKGKKLGALVEDDTEGPIRDSPNNLFLTSSMNAHPTAPVIDEAAESEELPTVTYVFRGKRQTFPNPLYNLPPEVHERAKLPPEHPNFSPSPTIKPKRLFVKEMAIKEKKKTKRRTPSPVSSPSPTSTPSPRRSRRKATSIKTQRAAGPTAS